MPAFYNMSCCGMQEIADLHDMYGSNTKVLPDKDAPVRFLAKLLATDNNKIEYKKHPVHHRPLPVVLGPRTPTIRAAHVVFEDAHGPYVVPYGKIFAKFILKNKLGSLICTKPRPNPRYFAPGVFNDARPATTKHVITTYVWTPDWDAAFKIAEPFMPPDLYDASKPPGEIQWHDDAMQRRYAWHAQQNKGKINAPQALGADVEVRY